jgi:hypothetical protein
VADPAGSVAGVTGDAGNADDDATGAVVPTGDTGAVDGIPCPEEIGSSTVWGATMAGATAANSATASGNGWEVGVTIAAIGAATADAGVAGAGTVVPLDRFALDSTSGTSTGDAAISARKITGRAVPAIDGTSWVVAAVAALTTGVAACVETPVAAVGATATVATGGVKSVGCGATGSGMPCPTEMFSAGNAGTSIPDKTGCSVSAGWALSAGNDGTFAAVPSTVVVGWTAAAIPTVATLGAAARVIGDAGLPMTGRATFRRPLVGIDEVAPAVVFALGIPKRPAAGVAAPNVEEATAGTVPAVKLVTFGTVGLRRGDCVTAGVTGNAWLVKLAPATLVGR